MPIVAARTIDSEKGQVLLLWVRKLLSLEALKLLAEDFEDEFDMDEAELDDLANDLFGDDSEDISEDDDFDGDDISFLN